MVSYYKTVGRFLAFNETDTPERILEMARKNLGETEELKEECLRKMKTLIRGIWNPDICSFEDLETACFVTACHVAQKESPVVNGIIAAVDVRDMSFTFGKSFISNIFLWKTALLESIPMRISGIHVINASAMYQFVMAMIGPLLPKKFKDRLWVRRTHEEFSEHMNTLLPQEFGGSHGELNDDQLIGELMEFLEKMKNEQHYCIQ